MGQTNKFAASSLIVRQAASNQESLNLEKVDCSANLDAGDIQLPDIGTLGQRAK